MSLIKKFVLIVFVLLIVFIANILISTGFLKNSLLYLVSCLFQNILTLFGNWQKRCGLNLVGYTRKQGVRDTSRGITILYRVAKNEFDQSRID